MRLNILSVGNEDAVFSQRYLAKIAKSDDYDIVSGVVYISGASSRILHDAIEKNEDVFTFECNSRGSIRTDVREDFSFTAAVDWTDWDYIVLFGDDEDFSLFAKTAAEYIRENSRKTKLCIAAKSSERADFSFADMVVPVCRDEMVSSRCTEFLQSAVLFEMLTGRNMTKNSYRLPFVESETTAVLKEKAHTLYLRYTEEIR